MGDVSNGINTCYIDIKPEVVTRVAENMLKHEGTARVFDSEESAMAAIYAQKIKPGDVVWFGEYAGVEFKIGDEQILFMKDVDIVAIVTDMPEQEIN